VHLWDVSNARLVTTLASREGRTAALTALDGDRIVVAWDDGQVDALDTSTVAF
jgi:hypothetical protein